MSFSLREAVPDDSEAVAALHVACWGETYRGLLPDKMIDAVNLPDRTVQWQRALERRADVRVMLAEDAAGLVGFASGGPARGGDLGATREIYALYVLRRPNAPASAAPCCAAWPRISPCASWPRPTSASGCCATTPRPAPSTNAWAA